MCGGSGRWSLFVRFRVFWAIFFFCVCVVELLFSMSSSCSSVFISSPRLLIARSLLCVVVGLLCMLCLCGFVFGIFFHRMLLMRLGNQNG